MTDFSKLSKAYERDQPRGDAYGWIQWKGTEVCVDLRCICGHDGHFDGESMYTLICPECKRHYLTGCNIKLIELSKDEIEALEDWNGPIPISITG